MRLWLDNSARGRCCTTCCTAVDSVALGSRRCEIISQTTSGRLKIRCLADRPRSFSRASRNCSGTASPYKSSTPLRSPPGIKILHQDLLFHLINMKDTKHKKKELTLLFPLPQQLQIHRSDLF